MDLDTDEATADISEEQRGWLVWIQLGCLALAVCGIAVKLYGKCKDSCEPTCHAIFPKWRGRGRGLTTSASIDLVEDAPDGNVLCYLCNKRVPREEWNNKEESGHRSYCAVKSKTHRDLLSELPRTSLPCEQCGELMRIWPMNLGPQWFRCKETQCSAGDSLIRNNGTNRFNCFTCDLDICRECGDCAEMADIKEISENSLKRLSSGSLKGKSTRIGSRSNHASHVWRSSASLVLGGGHLAGQYATSHQNESRSARYATTPNKNQVVLQRKSEAEAIETDDEEDMMDNMDNVDAIWIAPPESSASHI